MDYQYQFTDCERIKIALEGQLTEKLKDIVTLWFKGALSKLVYSHSIDFALNEEKYLDKCVTKVLEDYDIFKIVEVKKLTNTTDNQKIDKLVPLLDVIPEDADIEYMWLYQEKCGLDVDGLYLIYFLDEEIFASCRMVYKTIIDYL